MPRCPCLAHRGLYAERRFHRREVVSGLLHRLRLHRLQGWWDAGTGWWDAGAEAEVSGSTEARYHDRAGARSSEEEHRVEPRGLASPVSRKAPAVEGSIPSGHQHTTALEARVSGRQEAPDA